MYQKMPADGQCAYVSTAGEKCDEPYKASGFCAGHWRRNKLGQDMDPPIRSFQHADTETRFWRFVERGPDCWEWSGCRDAEPFDYGQFYDDRVGRARRAHVVMWELIHGKRVPKGKVVRHTCDNPPCVKPQHLILGTPPDNVHDMVTRNRQARGSQKGTSKLTEELVTEIRLEYAEGATQRELSEKYGVIQQTVSQIVRRKTWTHI